MLSLMRSFLKEEDGMGTVEIVVIIAVLVTIALVFRTTVTNWVKTTLGKIFGGDMKEIQDDTY